MVEAKLKSPIPFREEDALANAPVKWDLGVGPLRIHMATPLFSFNMYELFKNMVSAIKIQSLNGADISLQAILDSMDDEAAKESGLAIIVDALTTFHTKYDMIPKNFAELLISVSDPINLKECADILSRWALVNGFSWEVGSDNDDSISIREALSTYCTHVLDIDSCVRILEDLQRVNVEVKKKLAGKDIQQEQTKGKDIFHQDW